MIWYNNTSDVIYLFIEPQFTCTWCVRKLDKFNLLNIILFVWMLSNKYQIAIVSSRYEWTIRLEKKKNNDQIKHS